MKSHLKSVQDVPQKEIFSYSFTNFGQVLIYAIIYTFLMQYGTDVLAISPAIIGAVFLGVRIWDAINDPIMGVIVDKTHTKWGKCKPYLLFTPIPVAICCILLFMPVKPESTFAIVYFSIMYVIFTMVYTMNDIPFWGMSAVITKNPDTRVKIVSTTRIVSGFASAIITVLFMVIVNATKAKVGLQNGYLISTVIFSVLGVGFMLQGFFFTKERAQQTPNNIKARDSIKLMFKTKPLLINLIAGIFVAITNVGTLALTTYFTKWNIWALVASGSDPIVNFVVSIFKVSDPIEVQALFTPILSVMPAIAMLSGLMLTPYLCKNIDKRKVLLFTSIFGGIINIIFYFVGYSNLIWFVVGRFFGNIPFGIWSGITTSMFGDSVDILEYKTGKRYEGLCFSLLTFVGKFAAGISTFLIGMFLTAFKYNSKAQIQLEELIKIGDTSGALLIQQPSSALKGIFLLTTLVMGIGQLVMVIPFFFYKFNKKEHLKILKELENRKASSELNAEN